MTFYRSLIALTLCTLVSVGCAKKTTALKVYPTEGLPFAQKFTRAYLSQNEIGDYEVLLVSEGSEAPKKQGKILYPRDRKSVV